MTFVLGFCLGSVAGYVVYALLTNGTHRDAEEAAYRFGFDRGLAQRQDAEGQRTATAGTGP